MSHLPNSELILKYLNKICENRNFEKSPRNVRLLKFLTLKAIEKEDVTEYTIGIELFENNYEPDKNDSKVRVYMYNLRKKLDEYYQQEGLKDSLIFTIHKGQYNLTFERITTESKQVTAPTKQLGIKKIISLTTLSLLLITLICFLFRTKETNYCWHTFFNSSNNICVVADHTFVYKKVDNEFIPTINQYINSEADFFKYTKENPQDTLKLTNYTLFSKMAPFSIKTLTAWFLKNNSDFNVRLESKLTADELKDNNIFYIGQFKTMNVSSSIFLKNSHVFSYKENGFVVSKKDNQKLYSATFDTKSSKDYAIVSYFELENGKKALYFVSNNDIGVTGTVNNFTNPEWLSSFFRKLPNENSYFNALFEVNGIQRREINSKLIELEIVKQKP
ncbi:hypothetical protein [Wenyingzhuangia sp. IMCC45574]